MDSLFFGQKHSLRHQNATLRLDKVIGTPEHFVQLTLASTGKYSTLGVSILSSRHKTGITLDTTRAEFRRDVEAVFETYFGAAQWDEMARALTRPPRWTCIRVAGGGVREDVISELRQLTQGKYELSPVPELDDCIRLDFAVGSPASSPSCVLTITEDGDECRVIVDTGCGEAVLRGADVFAPGVKGCTAGLQRDANVSVWIDLDNALMRGAKDPMAAAALASSSTRHRLLCIGQGVTRQSRAEMIGEDRQGVAVQMVHRPSGDSPSLHSVADGRIYLQNLPSALVCHALRPEPGELVLDMCSSPGGKTSHVAQMMHDTGVLVACDRTVNKLVPVKQCCDKFAAARGLRPTNEGFLYCCRTDSSKSCLGNSSVAVKPDWSECSGEERKQALLACVAALPMATVEGIRVLDGGALPLGVFDRVLLDGPCSSLGLRPRFSHIAATNKSLEEMAMAQKRMLFNAIMLVRVGGVITYSTCTFNPGENECVVRWALDLFAGVVRLVPVLPRLGQSGLVSVMRNQHEADMVQRFCPSHRGVDSIGFFVAKFEKLKVSTAVDRVWG